jgi:hypothetical protein
MRESNIENCIFNPIQNVKNNDEEPENVYITLFGEQNFIDEKGFPRTTESSKNVYAKKTFSNGNANFFVKASRYGKLYNPMGMYTEGNANRISRMTGSNEFVFKKVNLRIFELYTSFLKTRNIAWLNNAEREML